MGSSRQVAAALVAEYRFNHPISFFKSIIQFKASAQRLSIVRLLTSIFLQNEALRDEASQGNRCEPDPLIPWLKAAIKDKRIKAKDPELAAKMFRGLIEGSINYPALYEPQKTAAELKPLKEEIIALFLSRYG